MTFEEFKASYQEEVNKTHTSFYKTYPTSYTVGIRTIIVKGLPLLTDEELKIEFTRLYS